MSIARTTSENLGRENFRADISLVGIGIKQWACKGSIIPTTSACFPIKTKGKSKFAGKISRQAKRSDDIFVVFSPSKTVHQIPPRSNKKCKFFYSM